MIANESMGRSCPCVAILTLAQKKPSAEEHASQKSGKARTSLKCKLLFALRFALPFSPVHRQLHSEHNKQRFA
jgi:hypothetical protein